MITNDMRQKMDKSISIVHKAIEEGGGHTILSTGITGDDARLAKAVVDVGVKLVEPNHPALALARGYKGVTTMHDAEQVRHEIRVEQMAEATQGVRNVVGKDIYITVGIPGGFTEVVPKILTDEDFILISNCGADGLHTHKSTLYDLEALVKKAHEFGLCVDAYIGLPTDLHTFGISAQTPEEVAKVAKQMEEVGTDMIGMMTGMSYEGVKAGEIHPQLKERLCALVETVKVPTLAEGGINLTNFQAFVDTGVNILVIGTSIDKMVEKAAQDVVLSYLNYKPQA
ncbi:thiamine phosphate synthase [Ruminococcaceae bacterium OttesenSCG-928-I18]|nr:thiamine phosphate synthase [Ruminococcaceae bacterium OttesenSCG-928-I18]